MLKLLGGVFLGAFVGGMVFEILKRTKPEVVDKICRKAQSTKQTFVEAFREGYATK